MRRRTSDQPAPIPAWVLRQEWQDFDGEESLDRQEAWAAAVKAWARQHGVPLAEVLTAINEHASRLLEPQPQRRGDGAPDVGGVSVGSRGWSASDGHQGAPATPLEKAVNTPDAFRRSSVDMSRGSSPHPNDLEES